MGYLARAEKILIDTAWLSMGYATYNRLPTGICYAGNDHPADVELLYDVTYIDAEGNRQVKQQIFDALFATISSAKSLLILDFFLFNDFQGAVRETTLDLCGELTAVLIEKRQSHPDINILFITDPINTIYGGAENPYINQLLAAGIEVITTDLDQLRDSNPLYSFFWRLLARPFGNNTNGLWPTPFSDGKITLRSYLRLFNLKANHRKTLIADDGNNGWTGMVLTGNPHNGSSAHRNIALRFTGDAVNDLYISERAVLEMCRHDIPATDLTTTAVKSDCKLQVLTEKKIKLAVPDIRDRAKAPDAIDMILFYLSDRDVIKAIQRAHNRGVLLRIILDPNKDAFGMRKIGIPNRPVAHDLNEVGVPIRWADTHGEQCPSKLMMYRDPAGPLSCCSVPPISPAET